MLLPLLIASPISPTVVVVLGADADPSSKSTADAEPSCSDSADLRRRVALSIGPDGRPTKYLNSLSGTLDGVLSPEDCQFLTSALRHENFRVGGGYEHDAYEAPKAFSGLGLKELSSGKAGFETAAQYDKFMQLRERIRKATERALGLCPGTLAVDFTHVTQKTPGGSHRPHADNCAWDFKGGGTTCPSEKWPYPNRVAASIVYLNDSYEGGEFYWADHETGEPALLAKPKPGRMTYFTSGPENLHGALPVLEPEDGGGCIADHEGECETPRRLAVAMWYVANDQRSEPLYTFRGENSEGAGTA